MRFFNNCLYSFYQKRVNLFFKSHFLFFFINSSLVSSGVVDHSYNTKGLTVISSALITNRHVYSFSSKYSRFNSSIVSNGKHSAHPSGISCKRATNSFTRTIASLLCVPIDGICRTNHT